jgi:hypothetical protein
MPLFAPPDPTAEMTTQQRFDYYANKHLESPAAEEDAKVQRFLASRYHFARSTGEALKRDIESKRFILVPNEEHPDIDKLPIVTSRQEINERMARGESISRMVFYSPYEGFILLDGKVLGAPEGARTKRVVSAKTSGGTTEDFVLIGKPRKLSGVEFVRKLPDQNTEYRGTTTALAVYTPQDYVNEYKATHTVTGLPIMQMFGTNRLEGEPSPITPDMYGPTERNNLELDTESPEEARDRERQNQGNRRVQVRKTSPSASVAGAIKKAIPSIKVPQGRIGFALILFGILLFLGLLLFQAKTATGQVVTRWQLLGLVIQGKAAM